MTQPETPRQLAEEALGQCTCISEYKMRELVDPQCNRCENIEAVTATLAACEAATRERCAKELLAQLTGGAGSQIDEEAVRQMIYALSPAPVDTVPTTYFPALCTHDWEAVLMPGCTAPKAVYRCKTCGETQNSMWERP